MNRQDFLKIEENISRVAGCMEKLTEGRINCTCANAEYSELRNAVMLPCVHFASLYPEEEKEPAKAGETVGRFYEHSSGRRT
jgi:hypothetical protein